MLDPAHPVDWLRRGRLVAVVALTALHLYPIVYFNVQAALASVNVEMEEAAASFGSRGLGRFFKITLPAILPSVFAAASIVLIWGLTELGVPLICDFYRVTSVQFSPASRTSAATPSLRPRVIVLVATLLAYLVTRALLGRSRAAGAGKTARRRIPRPLTGAAGIAAAAGLTALLSAAALPNVAVVLLALARDWYGTVLPSGYTLDHVRAAIGHDMVIPAIANSLRYVVLSTAFDLLLGTTIAVAVVRWRSPGARVLDAAAMLPLAVPGLVMAFGYLALSREGRPLAFLNPARDPTPCW